MCVFWSKICASSGKISYARSKVVSKSLCFEKPLSTRFQHSICEQVSLISSSNEPNYICSLLDVEHCILMAEDVTIGRQMHIPAHNSCVSPRNQYGIQTNRTELISTKKFQLLNHFVLHKFSSKNILEQLTANIYSKTEPKKNQNETFFHHFTRIHIICITLQSYRSPAESFSRKLK